MSKTGGDQMSKAQELAVQPGVSLVGEDGVSPLELDPCPPHIDGKTWIRYQCVVHTWAKMAELRTQQVAPALRELGWPWRTYSAGINDPKVAALIQQDLRGDMGATVILMRESFPLVAVNIIAIAKENKDTTAIRAAQFIYGVLQDYEGKMETLAATPMQDEEGETPAARILREMGYVEEKETTRVRRYVPPAISVEDAEDTPTLDTTDIEQD